jgi:S-adenosylmethionine:tRNA ribosyltransferase-isomerase
LHVGLGTFKSVETNDIRKHAMHQEHYACTPEAALQLNQAKAQGKKILAVGTTVCRVLECCSQEPQKISAGEGWTDIFIYPGYKWKYVDALFTNFHQPQTTLIMLVASLWGREATLKMYKEAIDMQARLFSYGDAMLILP